MKSYRGRQHFKQSKERYSVTCPPSPTPFHFLPFTFHQGKEGACEISNWAWSLFAVILILNGSLYSLIYHQHPSQWGYWSSLKLQDIFLRGWCLDHIPALWTPKDAQSSVIYWRRLKFRADFHFFRMFFHSGREFSLVGETVLILI